MEIRVLGPGCPRCHEVEKRTRDVLAELDIPADLQLITDINKIVEYRIFSTPGVVINGVIKSQGKIPSKAEIKKWIEEEKK
jgi:small redox-active disulfide protein 2